MFCCQYVGVPPHCVKSCGRGYFKTDDGDCKPCPEGAQCDAQLTLAADMVLMPDYWRTSASSSDLKVCPTNRGWCVGGSKVGQYCKDNHEGAYCSVCASGYAMQDGECRSCDDIHNKNSSFYVVILGLVVMGAAYIVYRSSAKVRSLVAKLNTRSMIVKLKWMYVNVVTPASSWIFTC